LNLLFVSLAGALFGLLHAPAQLVQQRPDIIDMIRYPELPLNHFQDAWTSPQLVGETTGSGAAHENLRQLLFLFPV
jgi:hypothetical protein